MEEQATVVIEEAHSSLVNDDMVTSLNRLSSQLNTNPQALTTNDLLGMLSSGYTYLFFALNKETKQIVGMITLVIFRTPYKMKGTLEDLVVDESARGQKLGEKLILAAIAKAKEKGIKSLTLTSHPSRVVANKLYQRLGFEKRDTNVYRVNL